MFSAQNKHRALTSAMLVMAGVCASFVLILKNNYLAITVEDYDSLACKFLHVRLTYLDWVTQELQTEGVYQGLSWFFDHNAAFYLYLSHLSVSLNLEYGQAFLVAQLMAIVFLMGVFPLLIYKITQSVRCALLSILLFFAMSHLAPASMLQINDCYWAYYLVIAIGMPVLYLFMRNPWSRGMWGYAALLGFTIAICDLVRSSAGIFLWLTLLAVVIYKHLPLLKGWCKGKCLKKLLPFVLGICLLFYCPNLFTQAVPDLYLVATGQDVSARLDTMGPWHSLFIGLGWLENPDGLYYDDTCGYEQHPDTLIDAYLPQTAEYIAAIQASYFEVLAGHPFVYLLSYLLKVGYAVVMGIRPMLFFGLAFVLFDSALVAVAVGGLVALCYLAALVYMLRYCLKNEGKAVLQKLLPLGVLGLISLANGLLPAVIAMPTYVYIAGVVGAYDIFAVLLLFITYTHYHALRKAKVLVHL